MACRPGSPAELRTALLGLIGARQPAHVLRVAIDGPDAAGKTTLADALAVDLAGSRPVIRASIDGFHQPRAVRHRRGHLSAEGYYQDSFDHHAVRRLVLVPLGPSGDRWFRRATFNYRTDTAVATEAERAPGDAVLLFDGVFLLRPELRDHWDLRVFVDVSPQEAVRRALVRDVDQLGGPEGVRERYHRRYLPGQRRYRQRCTPTETAEVVVDNDDPRHPMIIGKLRR